MERTGELYGPIEPVKGGPEETMEGTVKLVDIGVGVNVIEVGMVTLEVRPQINMDLRHKTSSCAK